MTSSSQYHSDLTFRSILSSDFEQIKALHNEFFPVKYTDEFYRSTCDGIGLHNGKLFSSIAVDSSGQIVGFVLAQLFEYRTQCEDKDLFSITKEPRHVCYIITLGVIERSRKSGLGSDLISHCVEYASTEKSCGAVYLHVLHSNHAAIAFYRRNGYTEVRRLDEFYYFNDAYHTAYLYVMYVNGYGPPLATRMWSGTSYLLDSGWSLVQSLFAIAAGPASALALLVPFGVRIFGAPAAPVLPRLSERAATTSSAAEPIAAEQC